MRTHTLTLTGEKNVLVKIYHRTPKKTRPERINVSASQHISVQPHCVLRLCLTLSMPPRTALCLLVAALISMSLPARVVACAEGETGANCALCAPGKFKPSVGTVACENCRQGTFSPATGATSNSTCQDCPGGTFGGASGRTAESDCMQCNSGTYSLPGAKECEKCHKGTYSTTVGANNSSTCIECSAGKYGQSTGRGSETGCLLCVAGKFSASTGATASTTCTTCAEGKFSSVEAATTCWICPAGKYAGAQGKTFCTSCGLGKYSNQSGATSGNTCTDCVQGTYSMAIGANTSGLCVPCEAGKYSTASAATSASTCHDCPAYSYSGAGSMDAVNCSCGKGYSVTERGGSNPDTASAGASGHTSDSVQACSISGVCSDLNDTDIGASALQAWSDTGIQRWIQSQLNKSCDATCSSVGLECSSTSSRFPRNLGASVTKAIFKAAGTECLRMSDSSSLTNDLPSSKPFRDWAHWTCFWTSDSDAPKCSTSHPFIERLCPCGNYSGVSETTLAEGKSESGYRYFDGVCRDEDGDDVMLAFVNDAVSKDLCAAACNAALRCNAFEWYPNKNSCWIYTANASDSQGGNSLKPPTQGEAIDGGNAECYIMSVHTRKCVSCAAGSFKDVNGSAACTLCPAGKYSTASAAPSASTCSDCPAYSYSDAGSMDEANCSCGKGYTVIVEGGGCVACAAGSFKDVNGSAACTLCPAVSSSPVGSAEVTSCTCNSGSEGPDGGVCVCQPGYEGEDDGDSCVACVEGKFKNATGTAECQVCGKGTYSRSQAAAFCLNMTISQCPQGQNFAVKTRVCVESYESRDMRFQLQKSQNPPFQSNAWKVGCFHGSGSSDATECKSKCAHGCCGYNGILMPPFESATCKENSCSGGGCCAASENICEAACETYFKPYTIYHIPEPTFSYCQLRKSHSLVL